MPESVVVIGAHTQIKKSFVVQGQYIPNENNVQLVTSEVEDSSKRKSQNVAERVVPMYSASLIENMSEYHGQTEQQPDKDVELSPVMGTGNDEATEDYQTADEPVERVVRDEVIANLLPGIAEQFMEPATTGGYRLVCCSNCF